MIAITCTPLKIKYTNVYYKQGILTYLMVRVPWQSFGTDHCVAIACPFGEELAWENALLGLPKHANVLKPSDDGSVNSPTTLPLPSPCRTWTNTPLRLCGPTKDTVEKIQTKRK